MIFTMFTGPLWACPSSKVPPFRFPVRRPCECRRLESISRGVKCFGKGKKSRRCFETLQVEIIFNNHFQQSFSTIIFNNHSKYHSISFRCMSSVLFSSEHLKYLHLVWYHLLTLSQEKEAIKTLTVGTSQLHYCMCVCVRGCSCQ